MATSLGEINFNLAVRTRGFATADRAMRNLQRTVRQTEQATGGITRASETASRGLTTQQRASQQAARGLEQLQRSLGGAERAQVQLGRAIQQATNAQRAGLISGQRAAALIQQAGQRFSVASVQSRDLRDNLAGMNTSFRNLSSAAVLAMGPLSGVGARFMSIAAILNRSNLVAAGFFATMSAGLVTLNSSIRAADAAAISLGRLEGVLRASGQAASLTGAEVQQMARNVDQATLGSTRELEGAAAQLLTFTNVTGENLERLLFLTQDIADAGFGNVSTAAEALGRALEDPAQGIQQLARRFPVLRGEIGDTIRRMAEMGRETEAAELILETLESRIGGVAQSIAQQAGLSAALDNLSFQWRELQEALGENEERMSLIIVVIDEMARVLSVLADNVHITERAMVALGAAMMTIPALGLLRWFGLALTGAQRLGVAVGAGGLATAFAESQRGSESLTAQLQNQIERVERLTAATQGLSETEQERSARKLSAAEAEMAELNRQIEREEQRRREAMEALEAGEQPSIGAFGGMMAPQITPEIEVDTATQNIERMTARLDDLRTEAERLRAALRDNEEAVTDLGEATDTTGRNVEDMAERIRLNVEMMEAWEARQDELAESFNRLIRELDPARAAFEDYRDNLDLLQEALERGVIDLEQYTEALALLNQRFVEGSNAAEDLANDVDNAGNEAEAAERMFNKLGMQIGRTFEDALVGARSLEDAFGGILEMMQRMILRLTVINPLMNTLFGTEMPTLGGIGGIFGSIFGFAQGGIVDRPTTFPMRGGNIGLAGEAGPEAILPLKRGSSGNLGVEASGGGGGVVNNFGPIDLRGADAAAVARLEGFVRSVNASIEPRALRAMSARNKRM